MRMAWSTTGTALSIVMACAPVQAQEDRWAVEVRGGAAIPTQQVADDDFTTGVGFEATVSYRFMPHLGAYAGLDWMHFGPDVSFAGTGVDFEETGYALGLRFEHPLSGESGPTYWARGGATYDHLGLEDAEGNALGDSGHGFGWEAGAGFGLVTGALRLVPGVRFRALSRDVTVNGTTMDVGLRYLAVELGASFAF
jgi:hypothetical protein